MGRGWLLVGGVLASCGGSPVPAGTLWGGCKVVAPGPVCWAPEGRVTVWVPPSARDAAVTVDGARASGGREVDGGARYDFAVGEGSVVAVGGGVALRVVAALPGVERCGGPLDGVEPGVAGVCAWLDAREQFERGEPGAAIEGYREAIGRWVEAGWAREAAMARVRLAFVAAEASARSADAEPDVESAFPEDSADGDALGLWAYQRAIAARREGDLRHALRDAERAAAMARRVQSERAQIERAAVLDGLRASLGQLTDPLEAPAVVDGCEAADRMERAAWSALRGAQLRRAGAGPDDGRALLDLAASRYEAVDAFLAAQPGACGGRGRGGNRAVDRALLAWERGDVASMRRWLAVAADVELLPESERVHRLLMARSARAEGRAEEATRLARSLLNEEAGAPWEAWDVLSGLARDAGDRSAAIDAAAEAQALFLERSALAPLLSARLGFLETRAMAAGELAELRVAAGRAAEAFEGVRAWRSRLFAAAWGAGRVEVAIDSGLDAWSSLAEELRVVQARRAAAQASRARVARDQLAQVDAELRALSDEEAELIDSGMALLGQGSTLRGLERGEVMITATPLRGSTGLAWRPMLRHAGGVRVGAPVAASVLEQDPSALWRGFSDLLRGATTVTWLLPGALEALDLHLGLLDGAPLVAGRRVRWSLDRATDVPTATVALGAGALVIGDPEGRLPEARAEASAAVDALRGWGVETWRLGAGADLGAVEAALDAHPVGWLHVAGHGRFAADGWDAAVALAEGTSWGVRDLLGGGAVPEVVVLSGCETARTGGQGVAGVGLAHAFVHRGSAAVVAAARPVDDALARRFAAAFYAASPRDQSAERAFSAAVVEVGAEAGVFRLVVP
jgi:hypothetical protein